MSTEYTKCQKLRVRTDYDGCDYITAGRVYDAEVTRGGESVALVKMADDDGNYIHPVIGAESGHIGDNYWEVVS